MKKSKPRDADAESQLEPRKVKRRKTALKNLLKDVLSPEKTPAVQAEQLVEEGRAGKKDTKRKSLAKGGAKESKARAQHGGVDPGSQSRLTRKNRKR